MNSHFDFIAAVERDLLGGDPQFPTGLKVLAALKEALDDVESPVSRIAALVSSEPLVVARLLRLANCVSLNPRGHSILSVEQAIQRVGFNIVRTAAAAVAVAQMREQGRVPHFVALADETWLRSVQVSVLGRLLASACDEVSPDEAALCGLVSALGVFYLLNRAARYPGYSDDAQRGHLDDLLASHAPQVTARLVALLALPVSVVAVLTARQSGGLPPRESIALFQLLDDAFYMREAVFEEADGGTSEAIRLARVDAHLVEQSRGQLQDLLAALGQ